MRKISQTGWPEVVFGSSDSTESQRISRAVKMGELLKIAPRLYTSNSTDPIEQIVQRNLYPILGAFFPNAVLSHRTALEAGPSKDHNIILTYRYHRKIRLPGLTIRLVSGAGPQPGDTPFMGKLFLASRSRALLENMQASKKELSKTLSRDEIESYLDKLCRCYGIEELNKIRDEARLLAESLEMQNEFKALDALIGALLGTKSANHLESSLAKARSKGLPYDPKRLEIFTRLASELCKIFIKPYADTNLTPDALSHIAFFESYFSNYIEGTTFEVEEAADVIFHHKIIASRPADTHDIIATYRIVANTAEMSRTPNSYQEWIQLLQNRHHTMMSVRSETLPGQFKNIANRVGNTVFVQPELVLGTFKQAFDIYQSVPLGIARAILMMFIVSEIHPFLDGNGRIARIMMNAELVHTGECRIIIPTVYREDYLLALRSLSKNRNPDIYIKMLCKAQAFTSSIDFSNYEKSLQQLKNCNAFLEPHEGKFKF